MKRKNLKALSVTIAISLLTILCVNVYADPWIMPGSVDITDATEPEDYIPEIKTITSYDEYGMPRDENGSMLGSVWCYDPEKLKQIILTTLPTWSLANCIFN